jgi:hypothetical protein
VPQVLGRPSLASALSYGKMRDGVVAFARAEDAARYATCLEADLPYEVRRGLIVTWPDRDVA